MTNLSDLKSVRKIAPLFLLTFFAFTLLIFNISSVSAPQLTIELTSSVNGTAQLFLLKNSHYTETASHITPIKMGTNTLKFALNNLDSPLRLDPLQSGGTISIQKIYISTFNTDHPIDNKNITPLNQIDRLLNESNATTAIINTQSNDPQLQISFDTTNIKDTRLIFSLVLGAITALLASFIFMLKIHITNLLGKSDYYLEQITKSLKSTNFNWHEIGALFIIATILNGYFLNNFSLSIDDEIGALRQSSEVWIGQGRWTVYFIERFVFPQPAIPFAPFIVLCACLAISYATIVKLHGFKTNWKTYICYPVFCAYPTWWFISEFYSNIPALALGVLLVTIAAHITFKDTSKEKPTIQLTIGRVLLISLLLATAIGAYQSLILLYLAIGFGVTHTMAMRTDHSSRPLIRTLFIRLITIGVLGFFGALAYSIINYCAQDISGIHSNYLNSFLNLEKLTSAPLELTYAIILESARVYTGQMSKFGAGTGLATILLIAATLANITSDVKKSILLILLWGILLIAPFILNFLAGADGIPMRTMVALSYTTWLMAIITISSQRPSFALIGALLVILYELQIFGLTSQYIASASITQSHDRVLAADIYRRIGELSEHFDRDQDINIDVYGHKQITSPYASGWTSTMQASFFDWDGGNLLRMTSYMQVMGYQNIKMVPSQDRLKLTAFFEKMPVWPAKGSVAKLDNTYLVRLSKDADPSHIKQNN